MTDSEDSEKPRNCWGCDSCGMDMDMSPYCVNDNVLKVAREQDNRRYDFGLNVNPALLICKLKEWTPRRERT